MGYALLILHGPETTSLVLKEQVGIPEFHLDMNIYGVERHEHE